MRKPVRVKSVFLFLGSRYPDIGSSAIQKSVRAISPGSVYSQLSSATSPGCKKTSFGPQGRVPGSLIRFLGSVLRTATMTCHLPARCRSRSIQMSGDLTNRRTRSHSSRDLFSLRQGMDRRIGRSGWRPRVSDRTMVATFDHRSALLVSELTGFVAKKVMKTAGRENPNHRTSAHIWLSRVELDHRALLDVGTVLEGRSTFVGFSSNVCQGRSISDRHKREAHLLVQSGNP